MITNIRKIFLIWQMRRLIKNATRSVYSENFDFDDLLKHLTNDTNSNNLLRAYIAIRIAAEKKLNKTAPMSDILKEIRASEVSLADSELHQTIIDLRKAEAQKSLVQAETEFYMDRLAPEFSFRGIIYAAEKNKQGPLTQKEYNQFKSLSEQLTEVEQQIKIKQC
jgi:hypothetical protein